MEWKRNDESGGILIEQNTTLLRNWRFVILLQNEMIVLLFNNKNFTETIIHIYTCCSISHIIHILRLVCVVSEEAKQYMVKSFLFK